MATILLIEDDELVARTIGTLLEKHGHELIYSACGQAGLEEMKRSSADLVITDIFLPEVDGLEVVRTLRSTSKELPIIAISGGGRSRHLDLLQLAKKLGASAIMTKPIDIRKLVKTVTTYLTPAPSLDVAKIGIH